MATRLTAAERRDEVLDAALHVFAERGLDGSSTEDIATRAGISQPYLFRLFGTKKDLFLACVDRCYDLTTQTFREAAAAEPSEEAGETPGQRMGRAYVAMLADRELLLFQLQTYASADDADVAEVGRRRYEELRAEIGRLSEGEPDEVLRFMGQGMLLNVAAALRLDPESWIWEHEGDA